jgi:small subunit ribosomal protein S24e
MEIEITKKDPKPLLKRTEVLGRITFEGATPSRKEVVAAVSKAMNAKKDVIIVRRVTTEYGSQAADLIAYVYEDRKALEALERDFAIKKNTFEEEATPADAPAEKKDAEEAPAEATPEKEEAPAEAKPEEKKEEAPAEATPEAPKEEAKPEKKEGDA